MKINGIGFLLLLTWLLSPHNFAEDQGNRILIDALPNFPTAQVQPPNQFLEKIDSYLQMLKPDKTIAKTKSKRTNKRKTQNSQTEKTADEMKDSLRQKRVERNLNDGCEGEILSLENDMSEINEFFGGSENERGTREVLSLVQNLNPRLNKLK